MYYITLQHPTKPNRPMNKQTEPLLTCPVCKQDDPEAFYWFSPDDVSCITCSHTFFPPAYDDCLLYEAKEEQE